MEWKSIGLSYKLSLACGENVNYHKSINYPIPSSAYQYLSFQLSVQVYSLLGQTGGKRKAFFEGHKKASHIVKLPPRALECHKGWKSFSFCEI